MKRILKFLSLMLMVIGISIPVFATEKEITVIVDGKTMNFDVEPQIINGRTIVPFRAIFEELGATVTYSEVGGRISGRLNDDKFVNMVLGDKAALVSGEKVTLDTPPTVINGRTLVPVYVIAQGLGCEISWDDSTKTVTITSNNDMPSASTSESAGTVSEETPVVSNEDVTSIKIYLEDEDMIISKQNIFTITSHIKPNTVSKDVLDWISLDENILESRGGGKFYAKAYGTCIVMAIAPNGVYDSMSIEVVDPMVIQYNNYNNSSSTSTDSTNSNLSDSSIANSGLEKYYREKISELQLELAKVKRDTSYIINGVKTYNVEKANFIENEIANYENKLNALSSSDSNALLKAQYENKIKDLNNQIAAAKRDMNYKIIDENGQEVYTYNLRKVAELEQELYEVTAKYNMIN